MKFPAQGLYAIADTTVINENIASAVEAAVAGGAVLVQYRDKSHDQPRRRREAAALLKVCHDGGAGLIINDDVELAAAIGADGIHLGKNDPHITEARSRLGSDVWIGISCYDSLERAHHAIRQNADYIAFGSFYPSAVKPDAVHASPDLLQATRDLPVPVVAIGGITADNGKALIDAGANFLAIISAVFAADDCEAAAHRCAALFTEKS